MKHPLNFFLTFFYLKAICVLKHRVNNWYNFCNDHNNNWNATARALSNEVHKKIQVLSFSQRWNLKLKINNAKFYCKDARNLDSFWWWWWWWWWYIISKSVIIKLAFFLWQGWITQVVQWVMIQLVREIEILSTYFGFHLQKKSKVLTI